MNTSTFTGSTTFTITHARHISAKVATDLKRLQRLYGQPGDADISDYETEVVALLRAGYLGEITYGFRRSGKFIPPTLFYTAEGLAGSGHSDDPGRIRPGYDVSGASFYSYLTYSPEWYRKTAEERRTFKDALPFQRSAADEPPTVGARVTDRNYVAGGVTLRRSTLRPF